MIVDRQEQSKDPRIKVSVSIADGVGAIQYGIGSQKGICIYDGKPRLHL